MALPSFFNVHFLFYCLVIFLNIVNMLASYDGNETDYQVLLKIKSMIVSRDAYGPLTSWNSSVHFCDWTGVTCGKRHRRVSYLQLTSLGLKGSLSPHVGNLSFLRGISLSNNSFEGAIPSELGRLSRLRRLYFQQNEFNGIIPSNFSRCSNLERLMLSQNKLVGSIPKEISSLSKLTLFAVDRNNLTGGIPPFLGNITSMEIVSIGGNPLGGRIPDTLGNWKNLREFFGARCNLSGSIPYSFYNFSLITQISLSTNQLSGSLPPRRGILLPQLVMLALMRNQLSGRLPSWISNCSRLSYLDMSENKFSGKLTIDFSKHRDLKEVNLNYNFFGSKEHDEMKFIDSLKNCTKLETLSLSDCKFQGVIPQSIGNLSKQLKFIDLKGNQLYGSLPSAFGNLVSLTFLNLRSNQFTGNIPSSIGKLQNLQVLYLYDNKLSGPIPDSIGNLSMLNILSISSNMLEGKIPSNLGNCHRLSELYLYDNRLSGTIPTQLLQLSSLTISLILSRNKLSGSLPTDVGDLKMLSYLDLSQNNLSGDIPSRLGDCVSLSYLSLKGNLFQGVIPLSLSSLKGLEELDLSYNKLSGKIPRYLEQFLLKNLNLSFNDLEGEVPMVGVFGNASTFSVLGNHKLCGGINELGLHKCKEMEKHKKSFPMFVILILVMSTIITIICLIYAWYKKKTKSQLPQLLTSEQFLQVSYGQLLKATNGFSQANLIGTGGFSSVYKGVIDTQDRFVAIKVLNLHNQGAKRSFMRECEAWRNIRHRNLLKIITSCSSIDFQANDFKALVYEFMPNGSLYDWLNSNASRSRLNLIQRINILMDVASALDYLHNHCQPALVHGDLKPSNILFSDDMTAHIGDFGLTRFYGTTSIQNSSTGIRGTIGYAAPEYSFGNEMTTSGDVYSFGIVALEVMTGKRPTDDIFIEGLNLHKYSSIALPEGVNDVIDNTIMNGYQNDETTNAKKIEACLVSIIMIGVSCSVDSPQERMDMRTVLRELKHILDTLQCD